MLKTFWKNYWKNFKHIFTCLGVFFVFFAGAMSFLFKGLYKVVCYIIEGIKDLAGTFLDNLSNFIGNLFSNFLNDLDTSVFAFSKDYFKNLFSVTTTETFQETYEQATILVEQAVSQVALYFISSIFILVIGVIVSYIVTRKVVRGSMLHGKFFKRLLISIPYMVIFFGVPFLMIKTEGFVKILLQILTVIIVLFGSLFVAYLIHRNEGIKFKEIVNIKNTLLLIVSEFLCVVLSSMIFVIFYSIDVIVGWIIAFPLLIVSTTIIGASSESYVIDLIENKNKIDCSKE